MIAFSPPIIYSQFRPKMLKIGKAFSMWHKAHRRAHNEEKKCLFIITIK